MDPDDAERRLKSGDWMITIGGLVFILAGLAIVAGGFALMDSEPNWWVMLPFGAGFIGMGFIVMRVFRTPKGKKRIVVRSDQFTHGRTSHSSVSTIYVDEHSTADEIDAAKEGWARRQVSHRGDWAEGRIRSSIDFDPGTGVKTVLVMLVIAAVLGVLSQTVDEIFGLFAVIVGVIACVFIVLTFRARIHRKKFGESFFVPDSLPVAMGQRLEGAVETGIDQGMIFEEAAQITLRCVRIWQESYRDSDNRTQKRTRTKTLYENRARRDPIRRGSPVRVDIPVSVEVPTGYPASTPGGSTGISWRLLVSVAVRGMDYKAQFELPVFQDGSLLAEAMEDVLDREERG
ncbi:MAG: hypothetical protein AAF501_00550 [Pseudomonadota bacterium]